jgi:hypothetical protein
VPWDLAIPDRAGADNASTSCDLGILLKAYLHERVCHHGLPLATAQHEIAANCHAVWVTAGRPTPQDFGYGSWTPSGTAPSRALAQGEAAASLAEGTVTADPDGSTLADLTVD